MCWYFDLSLGVEYCWSFLFQPSEAGSHIEMCDTDDMEQWQLNMLLNFPVSKGLVCKIIPNLLSTLTNDTSLPTLAGIQCRYHGRFFLDVQFNLETIADSRSSGIIHILDDHVHHIPKKTFGVPHKFSGTSTSKWMKNSL